MVVLAMALLIAPGRYGRLVDLHLVVFRDLVDRHRAAFFSCLSCASASDVPRTSAAAEADAVMSRIT
jgi:hypothetical protein